jgi:GMP synthase (glutamine-hydrolysing)
MVCRRTPSLRWFHDPAMAKPLRLLVVDGNVREARERHRKSFGLTPAESYSDAVRGLSPSAICDIALPADEGANLPDPSGLESYDAIFLTGSALHIYEIAPPVMRQIELMRAIYKSGTPCFGSCWGIQIGAVAAGGGVTANPTGREIGFARKITPTEAGFAHPLLAGRPSSFDAPAIHLDAVVQPPGDVTVLAANAMTPMQAAEIRHDGGVFWGVQYHPEFSLTETATILRRMGDALIAEGFRRTPEDVARYCDELVALDADPARVDLSWAHGLDAEVLDPVRRLTEIRNFLTFRVEPGVSARGRG